MKLAISLAVLLAAPVAAAADVASTPENTAGSHVHDGFYLRMAVGAGAFSSRDAANDSSSTSETFGGGGSALELGIGGTPRPGFVLAGTVLLQSAILGTMRDENGSRTTSHRQDFGMIGPTVDWYPNPRHGFHVLATFGPAFMTDYRDDSIHKTWTTRGGGAISIGTGYDAWISDNWSFGFLVRATGASLGGSERTDTNDGRYMVSQPDNRRSVAAVSFAFSALYH